MLLFKLTIVSLKYCKKMYRIQKYVCVYVYIYIHTYIINNYILEPLIVNFRTIYIHMHIFIFFFVFIMKILCIFEIDCDEIKSILIIK